MTDHECLEKIALILRERGLQDDVALSEIQDYVLMAGYDVPLRTIDDPLESGPSTPEQQSAMARFAERLT